MKQADGVHERFDREEKLSRPSDRKFGISLGPILALIGGLGLYSGRGWGIWAIAVGSALIVFGVMLPAALGPLNRAWTLLGLLLFHLVNPVVMALIYVTTIVPLGLLMRLAGKDPLRLKPDPESGSYWIKRRPPGPPPASMKNQF